MFELINVLDEDLIKEQGEGTDDNSCPCDGCYVAPCGCTGEPLVCFPFD